MRYVEAITEGALPIRLADIAEKAGVHVATVAEWRNRTPGFNDWLGSQLQAYVQHTWPAIQAVAVRFALRGSIDHMKFLRDLMVGSSNKDAQPPAAGGTTSIYAGAVIVNVPMPPGEIAGHALVRGLLDEAQVLTPRPT